MEHLMAASRSECKPASIVNAVKEGSCALLCFKLLRCYFALFLLLSLFSFAIGCSPLRLSRVLLALACVSFTLLLLTDESCGLLNDSVEHRIRVLLVEV